MDTISKAPVLSKSAQRGPLESRYLAPLGSGLVHTRGLSVCLGPLIRREAPAGGPGKEKTGKSDRRDAEGSKTGGAGEDTETERRES